MVGRAAELAAWDALLRMPEQAPRVLSVAGDPGMGKTRLLTEFRRFAERLAVPVLSLRGADVAGLSESAVLSAVDSVVLVDDAHRMDHETTTMLLKATALSPSRRTLLCLAYRPRQAPQRLVVDIEELARVSEALRVDLAPLTMQDCRLLLGPGFNVDEAAAMHCSSQGTPHYLEVLAHRSGVIGTSASCRFAAELEAVTPSAVVVARAAAVLGSEFDPAHLPLVSGLGAREVADGLDELARHDIVRAGAGRLLTFRHELFKDAVYTGTGPGWRRAAHARAADVLRREGASVAAQAEQLEGCADNGDVRAITVMLRAAGSARWRDPAAAARWYRSASALLSDEQQRGGRRARLMVAEADALLSAGQFDAGLRLFSSARAEIPCRRSPTRIRAITGPAEVARHTGRIQEARTVLVQETAWFLPGTPGAVRWLWLETAAMRADSGDFKGARSLIELLGDVRRQRTDEMSWRVGILALKAAVVAADDQDESGVLAGEIAGRSVDAWCDNQIARNVRTVLWVVQADILGHRYADALRRSRRAAVAARESGQPVLRTESMTLEGVVLSRTGRLSEAAYCFQQALSSAEQNGSRPLLLAALIGLSWATLCQGEVAGAGRLRILADDILRSDRTPLTAWVCRTLAEVVLLLGDPAKCVARLLAGGGGPELPRVPAGTRPAWYELLTRAELARRDVTSARGWVTRAAAAANHGADDTPRAFAALARSQLELALGDPYRACGHARSAAEGFDAAQDPIDSARARMTLGTALAALGWNEAIVERDRATALFADCGANWWVDQVKAQTQGPSAVREPIRASRS